MGSGFLLIFLLPAIKTVKAGAWNEVPCVVISSAVGRHRGSKSSTYSIDIVYEYEVSGTVHRSNRYEFLGGASSGQSGKQAVIDRYPPGGSCVCYVNPADPGDAVLTRSFNRGYLFAFIPGMFMAIGLAGIVAGIVSLRTKPAAAMPSGDGSGFVQSGPPPGPVRLRGASPLGKLIGMLFIALFWNGIISVFVVDAIRSWRTGQGPVGSTIFLIPFVVIGLLLIGSVGYFFLALYNPRVRLTVSSPSLRVGESGSIEWSFSSSAAGIVHLTIRLEGREEATYGNGKSRMTEKNTFASIPVFDSATTGGAEIRSGTVRISIPAGSVHSFSSSRNQIVWALKLAGEIPRWPDVNEEFLLDVQPPRGHPRGGNG